MNTLEKTLADKKKKELETIQKDVTAIEDQMKKQSEEPRPSTWKKLSEYKKSYMETTFYTPQGIPMTPYISKEPFEPDTTKRSFTQTIDEIRNPKKEQPPTEQTQRLCDVEYLKTLKGDDPLFWKGVTCLNNTKQYGMPCSCRLTEQEQRLCDGEYLKTLKRDNPLFWKGVTCLNNTKKYGTPCSCRLQEQTPTEQTQRFCDFEYLKTLKKDDPLFWEGLKCLNKPLAF